MKFFKMYSHFRQDLKIHYTILPDSSIASKKWKLRIKKNQSKKRKSKRSIMLPISRNSEISSKSNSALASNLANNRHSENLTDSALCSHISSDLLAAWLNEQTNNVSLELIQINKTKSLFNLVSLSLFSSTLAFQANTAHCIYKTQ
jgi:hypothetical protein